MTKLHLVSFVTLIVLASGQAFAQDSEQANEATAAATPATSHPATIPSLLGAQQTAPVANGHHLRKRQRRALKGALIGGAIGAGLGWFALRAACDAGSNCWPDYVKVIGLFAGIGAGIGALSEHNSIPTVPSLPEHRVRISGVLTPKRQQASATFAF